MDAWFDILGFFFFQYKLIFMWFVITFSANYRGLAINSSWLLSTVQGGKKEHSAKQSRLNHISRMCLVLPQLTVKLCGIESDLFVFCTALLLLLLREIEMCTWSIFSCYKEMATSPKTKNVKDLFKEKMSRLLNIEKSVFFSPASLWNWLNSSAEVFSRNRKIKISFLKLSF